MNIVDKRYDQVSASIAPFVAADMLLNQDDHERYRVAIAAALGDCAASNCAIETYQAALELHFAQTGLPDALEQLDIIYRRYVVHERAIRFAEHLHIGVVSEAPPSVAPAA